MRRHREDREEEIEKTFQTSVSELQTSILVALYNFQSYPNQNYPSTVQLIQIIQSSFSHNINIYIYIYSWFFPSLPLSSPPSSRLRYTTAYAYLFMTSLPIKALPCKVQLQWNTANIPTSPDSICIKPKISFGVNTCLLRDNLLHLEDGIYYMLEFDEDVFERMLYIYILICQILKYRL